MRDEQGVTLIETVVYLVLFGIIISVSMGVVNMGYAKYKLSQQASFYQDVNTLDDVLSSYMKATPTLTNNTFVLETESEKLTLKIIQNKLTLKTLDKSTKASNVVILDTIHNFKVSEVDTLVYKLSTETQTKEFHSKVKIYELFLNNEKPENKRVSWFKEVLYYVPDNE